MGLSLTANFPALQNVTLPLVWDDTGATLRVATGATGSLGTLSAGGDASVSWTIHQNPSWVTIATDPSNPNQVEISFSGAVPQINQFCFYIAAQSATDTTYYPIALEVRNGFTLQTASGVSTLSLPSFDATVADVLIQAYGTNGVVDTSVRLIPPANVPAGLSVLTSDETSILLRVDQPSSADPVGGLKTNTGSPTTNQLALQAYKPGSLYDSPERCLTQYFGVESLTYKAGTMDAALALNYVGTDNSFHLAAEADFLSGLGYPVTYVWAVTGTATGTISSGGGAADKSLVWTPSAAGNVTFSFTVKNIATGAVVAQKSISNVACAPAGSWQSTAAVKVETNVSVQQVGSAQTGQVTLSTPATELGAGEDIYLTISVAAAGTSEAAATLSTTSVTLTAASPSQPVSLTLPASSWNQKWEVTVAAANSTTSPTRTGAARVIFSSTDAPLLTVNSAGGQTFSLNDGDSLPASALTTVNASASPVVSTLRLEGAPDGIYINSSGQLYGSVITPGNYTFYVVANAPGYSQSRSSAFTLDVAQAYTPLAITQVTPSVASLPDGRSYTLAWGTSGTGTDLIVQQNAAVIDAFGANEVTLSQIGNSVLSVYGTSYAGNAYSIPVVVLSSSVVSQAALLNAPTIATISGTTLTVNWNPATVNGDYSAYRSFNLWLTPLPGGTPQEQYLAGGGAITGLEVAGSTADSRIFTETVVAGDYALNMQALSSDYTKALDAPKWDSAHSFPDAFGVANFSFDNTTLDLSEPLQITLDPAYAGADAWSVTFADGTSSGWLPLSVRVVTKTFTVPGTQNIVVSVMRNYSTANPPAKLMREAAATVYVMDQQYVGSNTTGLTGPTQGFGGESGFEISNNYTSGVDQTATNYAVAVRALVRDTVTNELKLMVATARGTDASSVFGTMALDVFPIAGRPRVKDLVQLPVSLQTVDATNIPVAIGTTTLPNFVVGKSMTDTPMQVATNSGIAPFNWYALGLPPGVKLSLDGTLSGTPTAMGSFAVQVSVMDSSHPSYIDEKTLTVNVVSDLAITTKTIPTPVVGINYALPLGRTGGLAPYDWEIVSGSMPLGLSLDPSSGIISGTPVTYNSTTDFSKVFTFTVQVTDSIGAISSETFTASLAPSPLRMGNPDQTSLFANAEFRVVTPVFGGAAPYRILSFTDDGVVGSGLMLTGPDRLNVVAGLSSSPLQITAANGYVYPTNYPYSVAVKLSASGGAAPYRFLLDPSASTTLPNATVSGDVLIGTPTGDGSFAVGLECVDALGETTTKSITIYSQQKNAGVYTISPVSVNQNGSTNPQNWSITKISALPDALSGAVYAPAAGSYYGLAVYQNGVLHMSQAGGGTPMSFEIISGSLPSGMVTNSGNSFTQTGDYSGIILFNASGGSYPTTTGGFSFVAEFSNIATSGGTATVVARESITVRSSGSGTTPVVSLSNRVTAVSLDETYAPTSGYKFLLPLSADGGSAPYSFTLQSGTTLPGISVVPVNGVPSLAASTLQAGTYGINVIATDALGTVSAPVAISVVVTETTPVPTYITASNTPNALFTGRTLSSVYQFSSDKVCNWTATGLPPGLSLTASASNKAYLTGTPTTAGTYTVTVKGTSVLYGTSAQTSFTVVVSARTASFASKPTTASVGVAYRAVNNNAILSVTYLGYQPGDVDLPQLSSSTGVVGARGVLNGGLPTTSVRGLSSQGFTMEYDYSKATSGVDVITLGQNLDTVTLTVGYTPLVATPLTNAVSVSEYSATSSFAIPVSVSGGLAPYSISVVSLSNSRFTVSGSSIVVSPDELTAGASYSCSVGVQVSDASGQVAVTSGTIQVSVRAEDYMTANFPDSVWNVNVSSGTPFTAVFVPDQQNLQVVLGHSPYQYYVDAVTLPAALTSFVTISPSKRVLAIQFNNSGTSTVVSDRDATLTASAGFTVPAVSTANAPAVGTYTISVTVRVVDATGLSQSATTLISLVVS